MFSRRLCPQASTSSLQCMAGLLGGVRQSRHSAGGSRSGRRVEPLSQRAPLRPASRALEDIVVPVKWAPARSPTAADSVGADFVGALTKKNINDALLAFSRRSGVRKAAQEQGLSDKLFHKAFVEFRLYCKESEPLPPDLHIKLADVANERAPADDLFPFFMEHARRVFPHLECMEDLRKISDLTAPHLWYAEARAMQRRIIYHAGPTNSGKTHSALQRFNAAKTGVYCGPLKLLAAEVYHKTASLGVSCDMTTGDDRQYAFSKDKPANHLACTVEMLDTTRPFEVAVIDEIQMVRDVTRGWAWTRALLGVCAEEIHVCGEPAAVELVREMLLPLGEEVELKSYERITPLRLLNDPVGNFKNVQDGDCIVCFNKRDIFNVSRKLESDNRQVAVVYGSLPPATKLAQARRFNDPEDPCKIMVATDAIGMGLNLHIGRVVFYSVLKPRLVAGPDGMESRIEPISAADARQIGGRAGRYGTAFPEGTVTTFMGEDLRLLHQIWNQEVVEVEAAGLRPTLDQIEMFAFHLPQASLTNLIRIFMSLVSVNESAYFLCDLEDTLFLADMIEHVKPMSLRDRYTFCLAPINQRQTSVCTIFLKFARRYSRGEQLTAQWFMTEIGWPFKRPERLQELQDLEAVFDMMETYLWFSYRFPEAFPHPSEVRQLQVELDLIIEEGVKNIVSLMTASETDFSSGAPYDPRESPARHRSSTNSRRRPASEPPPVIADILSYSDLEAKLSDDFRRKETALLVELVANALRLDKRRSKQLDAREQARILENIAQELESEWEKWNRSGRMPQPPSLRAAREEGLISQAEFSAMAVEYKKRHRILHLDHKIALNLAYKHANKASPDS